MEGRIVEVGKISTGATHVIDATDLSVVPGFVDPHTHYDAQIWWDPLVTCSSWHGVTTVVMGNCGVGIAPCRSQQREALAWDLVNVEGMSFNVLSKGVRWEWESFPEFMTAARQGMGRLIDSYAEGLMDKSPFELRITRLKARVAQLEAHRERLRDALGLRHDLQVVAGRLDECAARVRDHLDDVDWGGARCSSGPWSSAWISISRRSVWSFRHIVRGVVLRLFGTLLAEQNDE